MSLWRTPISFIKEDDLPLNRAYHWEVERANKVYLTQPMGDGQVRDYTWSHAMDEARRIAQFLIEQNYPAGSCIAILSKNCAHWIMADLAIWMAGHVSVPVYPTLTAESVNQILTHCEAKAVFVGKLDDWEKMESGVPDSVLKIGTPMSPPHDFESWDNITKNSQPLPGNPTRNASDLATLIYTSGTTGMPKGVMHPFSAFAWCAERVHERFTLTPEDRILSYLPLAHVAERWLVEADSFYAGFRVYFAESLETFVSDLQRARPTMFISVPRLWVKFQQGISAKLPPKKLNLLLKIPIINNLIRKKILTGLGLDQARFAGGGAAPMPKSTLNFFRALGLDLMEGYGMTENFGCSHSNIPGQARVGYVGQPYPGIEHKIDPETGEILMKSPALMTGYYKEPEKTAEVMTDDGFFRTGDVGEIDSEDRLKITGRAKEQFKTSKGKYVAPAPIENLLAAHPKIEALCVAGSGLPQPVALVMLTEDAMTHIAEAEFATELKQTLQAHLASVNATLNEHEKIKTLVVVKDQWNVENGFLTPTLKIKRNAIEAEYGSFLEQWYESKQGVIVQ